MGSSRRAETTLRSGLRALQRMCALLEGGAELDEDSRRRVLYIVESATAACDQIRSLVLLAAPRPLTFIRPALGADVERESRVVTA